MDERQHISLTHLWEYSRNLDPLLDIHKEHLSECEQCVSLLGLCRISPSLEHLKRRMKEEGIKRAD
jgi:hypothetical protein